MFVPDPAALDLAEELMTPPIVAFIPEEEGCDEGNNDNNGGVFPPRSSDNMNIPDFTDREKIDKYNDEESEDTEDDDFKVPRKRKPYREQSSNEDTPFYEEVEVVSISDNTPTQEHTFNIPSHGDQALSDETVDKSITLFNGIILCLVGLISILSYRKLFEIL
eukprot:TRINITY_DN1110_c2_g1_i2.p1 TRINITY_DN1110_c2_g1~~TRINITY_DN1110_c2_g1_i2.p1  ORF type:complete len:163 (+),score=48.33 TRINITY_DN1110_c2_g1_i2:496-984(+)